MTIQTEFESIIVCKAIVDLRFKGGWEHWINKYSMEDDGYLSRVSTMSGADLARTEKTIQKLGLLPPMITESEYIYLDYYIYALEYTPHKSHGVAIGSMPNWLTMHEPLINKMSLFEFEKLPLEQQQFSPGRPTFSFNRKAKIK